MIAIHFCFWLIAKVSQAIPKSGAQAEPEIVRRSKAANNLRIKHKKKQIHPIMKIIFRAVDSSSHFICRYLPESFPKVTQPKSAMPAYELRQTLPRRRFPPHCPLPGGRGWPNRERSQHRGSSFPGARGHLPNRCPHGYTGGRSSYR